MERALVQYVSGIQRRSRFKEHDPAFLIRYRTMLDSTRHDDELAFLYPHLTVANSIRKMNFSYRSPLSACQVIVDRAGSAAAGPHSENNRCGSGHDVASGEDARTRCSLSSRIGLNVAAFIRAQTRCGALHDRIGRGPDRHYCNA